MGSKGTHGFAGDGPNYDVNPVSIVGFGNPALTQNQRRPLFPNIPFDLGNFYGNDASSSYNAFEAKVEKRFTSGLQFITHYTFSHADGYDSNYYAISHPIAYGPVDFNRNHVFVFNTVYELPFGKGKKYMGNASRAMDYVVGGWQLSNTTNWSSGLPWTPSFGECGHGRRRRRLPPKQGPRHTSTREWVRSTRSLTPLPTSLRFPTSLPTRESFTDPGRCQRHRT